MALRSGYDANEIELRNAMKIGYDHMHRNKQATRAQLLKALTIMKDHTDNTEWVCYVP